MIKVTIRTMLDDVPVYHLNTKDYHVGIIHEGVFEPNPSLVFNYEDMKQITKIMKRIKNGKLKEST